MNRLSGVLFLTALASSVACAPAPRGGDTAPDRSRSGFATKLTAELRRAGFEPRPGGAVEQPFFAPAGEIIELGEGALQIFEFRDEQSAAAAAARIKPGGGTATSQIYWVEPPHFYRQGRIVVIYLGDDPQMLRWMEQRFGPPFAE